MSAKDLYYGGMAVAILALVAFFVLYIRTGMTRGELVQAYWPVGVVFIIGAVVCTLARFAGGDE
jgi:hypothetical protein